MQVVQLKSVLLMGTTYGNCPFSLIPQEASVLNFKTGWRPHPPTDQKELFTCLTLSNYSLVDINNFLCVSKISCWTYNSADINKNKLILLQALLIFFSAAQHFHSHINICHNFWHRKIWIFSSIYFQFYCLKLPMLFVKNIKLKKLILEKKY